MLTLVTALRIGERQGILRVAQLVGIQDDEAIVREVAAQLAGQLLERAVVRDGAATGADNHQQVVVVHLAGQEQQVFPLVKAGELSQRVAMFLLDEGLKQVARLFVGKEVDTTSQRGAHAAEVVHPLLEAGFVLGLGRHGHDDAPQGIDG